MSEHPSATKYLFLLSIGPVQSFIELARKSQDLWSGSFLLSHLVKATMERAGKEKGVNIVFPQISPHSGETAALPNHLLLQLDGGWDQARIRDFGAKLVASARVGFGEIIAYGMKQIGTVEDLSARQLKEALEVYWVAVPIDSALNHGKNFRRAEIALGGRKNLKLFSQSEPEQSLKCSLCGERQALHPPGATTFKEVQSFWQAATRSKFSGSEYLCAICLGKRYAPDFFHARKRVPRTRFPSTAEVAASSYKRPLLLNPAFTTFETQVGPFLGTDGCLLPTLAALSPDNSSTTVDSHWLYESNYSSRELTKKGVEEKDFATLKQAVKGLHKAVKATSPGVHLTSYYAVMIMDADKMGKKLSRVTTSEQHQEVSKALATFAAGKTKDIVEGRGHLGKLVYAGGDDLLAFVALESLLPLMEELRTTFATEMNQQFPALIDSGNSPFTISAGACISHYKSPLRVALHKARQMLALAKNVDGGNRNAFAMVVQTSGNHKQTVMRWDVPQTGSLQPLCTALIQLAELLRKGAISDRFIYRFGLEHRALIEPGGRINRAMVSLAPVRAEFLKLMLRAVDNRKLQDHFKCDETASLKKLGELAAILMDSLELSGNRNLGNFLSLLDVANFISRETNV